MKKRKLLQRALMEFERKDRSKWSIGQRKYTVINAPHIAGAFIF